MFKENRLVFHEAWVANEVGRVSEGYSSSSEVLSRSRKIQDLLKLLNPDAPIGEVYKEYHQMIARIEAACSKAAEGKSSADAVLAVQRTAETEFERERATLISRLTERAKTVVDGARKAAPVVNESAESASHSVQVGNRTFKVGDMIDDTYRLVYNEMSQSYAVQNAKHPGSAQFGIGNAEQTKTYIARLLASEVVEAAPKVAEAVNIGGRTYRVGEVIEGYKVFGRSAILEYHPMIGYTATQVVDAGRSGRSINLGETAVEAAQRLSTPAIEGYFETAAAVPRTLPRAPSGATIMQSPDGRYMAHGKDFPLQEVQNPYPSTTPPAAPRAAAAPKPRSVPRSPANPEGMINMDSNGIWRDVGTNEPVAIYRDPNGVMRDLGTRSVYEGPEPKSFVDPPKRRVPAPKPAATPPEAPAPRPAAATTSRGVTAAPKVAEAASETVKGALEVGGKIFKPGDLIDGYKLVYNEASGTYFLRNPNVRNAVMMGVGDAEQTKAYIARVAIEAAEAAPKAAEPAATAPRVVRSATRAPEAVGDAREAAVARGAARTTAETTETAGRFATEAKALEALAKGTATVDEMARFGWAVKTGIQDGRTLTVLVKGGRIFGQGLRLAGKVLVPIGIAIDLVMIGHDLYTLHGVLKTNARMIRDWKRRNNMPNPDSVSMSDYVTYTQSDRDSAFEIGARGDREAFERAREKVGFLNKAHDATIYAKGVVRDCQMFDQMLSKYPEASDILNPGRFLGEVLTTAGDRAAETEKLVNQAANGAARCRALINELSRMKHTLPQTKDIVLASLDSAARLADMTVVLQKSPVRDQSDGVMGRLNAAQRLVEADNQIALREQKDAEPDKPTS